MTYGRVLVYCGCVAVGLYTDGGALHVAYLIKLIAIMIILITGLI